MAQVIQSLSYDVFDDLDQSEINQAEKEEITNTRTMTAAVEASSSLRVGHFTFFSSVLDSLRN